MAEKKKGDLSKRQQSFRDQVASERDALVNDPSKLRERILTQQDLGRDVGSVRENFEAGRTLSMLATYAADGMVAKLGSGGLASPEDAITCWRKLFHAPGGVDFAEMGRAAAPLVLEVPVWQVMRGPLKVPKKERKLAVKGARVSAKEELEAAGPKEVFAETTAEDIKKNAQAGEVSKRDTIIGHHLVDAWSADKATVDCADGKRRELVPFFETVVDPWSYTQTVENFFYLSCRVKMGFAGIYLGLDGQVYLRPFQSGDLDGGEDGVTGLVEGFKAPASGGAAAGSVPHHAPRAIAGGSKQAITGTNQFVLQLDYQSWRLLVDDLKLTHPRLPHRLSSECNAPGAACKKYEHFDDAPERRKGGAGKHSKAGDAQGPGSPSAAGGAGGRLSGSKRRADGPPP